MSTPSVGGGYQVPPPITQRPKPPIKSALKPFVLAMQGSQAEISEASSTAQGGVKALLGDQTLPSTEVKARKTVKFADTPSIMEIGNRRDAKEAFITGLLDEFQNNPNKGDPLVAEKVIQELRENPLCRNSNPQSIVLVSALEQNDKNTLFSAIKSFQEKKTMTDLLVRYPKENYNGTISRLIDCNINPLPYITGSYLSNDTKRDLLEAMDRRFMQDLVEELHLSDPMEVMEGLDAYANERHAIDQQLNPEHPTTPESLINKFYQGENKINTLTFYRRYEEQSFIQDLLANVPDPGHEPKIIEELENYALERRRQGIDTTISSMIDNSPLSEAEKDQLRAATDRYTVDIIYQHKKENTGEVLTYIEKYAQDRKLTTLSLIQNSNLSPEVKKKLSLSYVEPYKDELLDIFKRGKDQENIDKGINALGISHKLPDQMLSIALKWLHTSGGPDLIVKYYRKELLEMMQQDDGIRRLADFGETHEIDMETLSKVRQSIPKK